MDPGLRDWADVIASLLQVNGPPRNIGPFLDLAEERACELVSRRNAEILFMVIETETRELIETFTTALRQAYQLLDELEVQRYLRERDASAVYDCSHVIIVML